MDTKLKPLAPVEYLSPGEVKKEMLEDYPVKVARKRAKQIIINSKDDDGGVVLHSFPLNSIDSMIL